MGLLPLSVNCCCCCDGAGRRRRRRGSDEDDFLDEDEDSLRRRLKKPKKLQLGTCGDFFALIRGMGKPAGAVYAAMTSKPEYSNRNYLALENASKPEAVFPCIRRGCFQFVDVEGSSIQQRVSTPCAPGLSPTIVGAQKPQAPVSIWVADLRCGGARDCIGSKLFSGDRAALESALRSWTAVGGGRGGVVRPRAQGEEITY